MSRLSDRLNSVNRNPDADYERAFENAEGEYEVAGTYKAPDMDDAWTAGDDGGYSPYTGKAEGDASDDLPDDTVTDFDEDEEEDEDGFMVIPERRKASGDRNNGENIEGSRDSVRSRTERTPSVGSELQGLFGEETKGNSVTDDDDADDMGTDGNTAPENGNVTLKGLRQGVSYVKDEDEVYDPESELEEVRHQMRRDRWKKRFSLILMGLLLLGCMYAIFLIFGVIMTDYGYGSDGTVQAQVMSVNDIQKKNAYNVIKVQYEKARVIYEKILMVDAQLGEGVADYVTLGAEYASIMDSVEDAGVKTSALICDSRYEPTRDLIYSWLAVDVWTYLTAITQALTMNDSGAADTAVVYKNYMYSDFALITDNVVTLGNDIKGVDLSDIMSWSPDTFKQDYLNGKTLQ